MTVEENDVSLKKVLEEAVAGINDKLKKLEGGRRDSNGGASVANGSVANLFRAGSVANLFGTAAPAPAPRRSSEGKSEGRRRSKGSDSKT